MNLLQKKVYDVCVIGSGAAGGFAAKILTEAGAEVILLEAGTKGRLEDLAIHDWPYELPKRGFGLNKQASLYPDNIGREVEVQGDRVGVDRIRTLGGRTFHWNAATFRFSADDFREHSLHGIEEDWPVTYEELAPFYDYVEREMHVFGSHEGLPHLPDGNFVATPPRLRCADALAQKKLAPLGIKVIPVRKAVLINSRKSRGGCHYCGHCMDVCDVRAIWSSDVTVIPEALATGKLTLRMNALARRILINNDGLVRGVSFIDRTTGKEEEIAARIVVLGCATIESARLLLNSKSEKFPNGLANNNDVVGRYLGGHVAGGVYGYIKDLVAKDTWSGDGMTDHAYIPRFNHLRGKPDYVGGFGVQLNYASYRHPHHAKDVMGFGTIYKHRVRDLQPALLHMGAFGKVEHRPSNRVTVHPTKTDKWGIPTPVINFHWSDNDRRLFAAMHANVLAMFDAVGMELALTNGLTMGGFASHEVGTVRMGRDPKTSVLNAYNQAHEVRNLFVVDGSSFTTMPEKNPTLTIAALAVRAMRYLIAQRKQGAL
ncbi:MAG TPA: GMC family oxidoreductase [Blastocatellia bacterium]|nr:GMC family oxidoreductase [Blastocatellia bacterium]